MFIALDKNSKRVSVWDSQKNQTYYCPVCNSELIIKDGKINEKHFAHKKACSDTWNYDMSYWHQKMQNYFPEHQREVVVSNRFGTHRADILIENTVIEFQHSKITAEEYQNRTNFFIRSGYRIAWVFDLSEQRECGYLQYKQDIDDNCDNQYLMKWSYAFRIFEQQEYICDYNKKYALWFAWGNEDIINKVIWTAKNEDTGLTSLKYFITSEHIIEMNEKIDANDFFISLHDWNIQQFKTSLNELNSTGIKYRVLYSGIKGKKKNDYICPRRNKFGIDVYDKAGCHHCKYCYMIAKGIRDFKTNFAVYCCYPTQIHTAFDEEYLKEHTSSYECNHGIEYNI
jgi:hypothetical protein